MSSVTMTPREIVAELDRHIIGQHDAKMRWPLRCVIAGAGSK